MKEMLEKRGSGEMKASELEERILKDGLKAREANSVCSTTACCVYCEWWGDVELKDLSRECRCPENKLTNTTNVSGPLALCEFWEPNGAWHRMKEESANAHAHGRAPARTVQGDVGTGVDR